MDSIGVYLNWFPAFLSANVYLKGPIDVYLDRTQYFFSASVCLMGLIGDYLNWFPTFLFCQCLSGGTC